MCIIRAVKCDSALHVRKRQIIVYSLGSYSSFLILLAQASGFPEYIFLFYFISQNANYCELLLFVMGFLYVRGD